MYENSIYSTRSCCSRTKSMMGLSLGISLSKETRENPFGGHVPLAGGASSVGSAAGIFFIGTVFFVTAGTLKILHFLKNIIIHKMQVTKTK